MRAFVIMVNDFPARVALFDPATDDAAQLEATLKAEQEALQRAKFAREQPGLKPEEHPIRVGYVHLHDFDVQLLAAQPKPACDCAALRKNVDAYITRELHIADLAWSPSTARTVKSVLARLQDFITGKRTKVQGS